MLNSKVSLHRIISSQFCQLYFPVLKYSLQPPCYFSQSTFCNLLYFYQDLYTTVSGVEDIKMDEFKVKKADYRTQAHCIEHL